MGDIEGFVWSYRRAIRLAFAVAGLCSLMAALALYLRAPVERRATLPFRLLFDGAAQNRYPNDTLFSPMEIVAPTVLREVFQANDLRRYGDYAAFEQSVFVLGFNPGVDVLTNQYQAILSNTRVTPVDRARIEEEFRTKRAALIDPVFSLNIRRSQALPDLPPELTQKILRDTLATWAEHANNRKRATRYNIPILSKEILDRSIIEREDYFIAIDILRAKTHRVMATIEELSHLPAGQLIRIGEQKLSIAEIRSNLEDIIRFKLEPLLDLIRAEGVTRNPHAIRLYANNQLFQLRLQREQSLSLVRSFQSALDSYTAQRAVSTPDPQNAGGTGKTLSTAPLLPPMDQSFLEQLMAFPTAADDQLYRRNLTDKIIEEGERAANIQREEAYYQDLANNLRTLDARGSGSPGVVALVKARTTQAFDDVSQAVNDVTAVYDQLSAQNLRGSAPLYTTTGAHTLRTRRAVSVSTLGLLVFLLFVLTFVGTLAGWALYYRLATWRGTAAGKGALVVLLAMLAGWSCQQPPPPPDATNELPFGVIDGPQDGKVVGREVEVSGWALDDTGVAEVRIYVDARYKMSAPLKIKRPDVTKVYPKYSVPDDMHGWWEVVDLGETAGSHNILAQAIDRNGATRDIGSVNVQLIGR